MTQATSRTLVTRPHHAIWPTRLPRELAVPDTTLSVNLEVTARRFRDKAAYRFFTRTLTYGELASQADAIAGWLQQHAGVRPGDRVALMMQNCPQMAAAFYGVLRADAVVVPVNPMNRAEELRHLIADSGAKVAFVAGDLLVHVLQAQERLPQADALERIVAVRYADAMPARGTIGEAEGLSSALADWLYSDAWPEGASAALGQDGLALIVPWQTVLDGRASPGPSQAQPDDMALLPYTSGTTGHPKGCIHTHRTLMPNAIGGAVWGHYGAESVGLCVVPMFHITGLVYGLLASVYAGGTSVLMPRWDRELAGRAITREGVTHWVCIPTMVIDLFASPHVASFHLGSLRAISGGGAAMPQAVAEKLRDQFGLTFAEGYGLTETAAPSHANPPERAKLQCLGIPIFGVDARVVDPQTLREVPIGESGEIVTRGPMVFKGYWRHPEATEAAFVTLPEAPEAGRFFRTGDLGRMDEEGYFFMTDRLKRMINASGFKVWPAEVEALLYRHPGVQEACIIAARDAYRGETVKAVVVLRPEARGQVSAQDIMEWSRQQMAAYKVPRMVSFVDSLPKSGSGKVMWRLLQDAEMAAEPTAAAPPAQ